MNTNGHEYGEEQIITDHAQSFALSLLLILDFSCSRQRDDQEKEDDLARATVSWKSVVLSCNWCLFVAIRG